MKNILITTDFSPHSKHTLECVLKLLQETQIPCRILLVNTYLVQEADPLKIIHENDKLKNESLQMLEQEKQRAVKFLNSTLITIDTASHLGSLGNVISHLLRKEQFDLVAMGKDGGRNIEKVSTLLKKQKVPLLITHEQELTA